MMGQLATLSGPRAGALQAALFHTRDRRLGRLAAKPICTVAPAITGTTQEGQTLTCSTGTWSGAPLGYKRVWRRGQTVIAGAVAATHVLVGADVGLTMTCTVTAMKGGSSASATSAGTNVVIAA